MKEMINILVAGSFVYLALGLQARYGAPCYHTLALIALGVGYIIRL